MRQLEVIDLCCGAGLFSAGFEREGFKIVLGVDVFPVALESFHRNHPGAIVWDTDLMEVTSLPRCDVVIGGPPCQPFSKANRTAAPERGVPLVDHFIHLAVQSRAKYWIMEEVPGVLEHISTNASIPRIETWDCSSFGARNLRPRIFAGKFPDPVSSGPPCNNPSSTVLASDSLDLKTMRDLQGVPSWMEFCGSETEQRKQIGNGVPLQMGEALARGIIWDLEGRNVKGHQSWHNTTAAFYRRKGGNRSYLSAKRWLYCYDCDAYILRNAAPAGSWNAPCRH